MLAPRNVKLIPSQTNIRQGCYPTAILFKGLCFVLTPDVMRFFEYVNDFHIYIYIERERERERERHMYVYIYIYTV